MSVPTNNDTNKKESGSFISFESTPFRWLMASHLTFFLAMQGQFLVRSILAWDLTDSELALAYVNLVIALPMVVGSFVGGAVIDRVERRKLAIYSQCIVVVNELIVLVLLMSGKLAFWHLLGTSFILGVMFPYIMPTRVAMIFPLMGRNRIGNAMAIQAGALNLARVLGPAGSGLLVALWSMEAAFIAAMGLHIFSIICMLKLKPCHPERREKKSLLEDISYSFSYVRQHREIFLCLVFGLFPMLIALPVFSLMVVFAEEVWQASETGLGLLMAMLGSGGIIGALWVAKVGDTIRRARTMIICALLFPFFLAAFSVSTSLMMALVFLLIANVFSNISQTLNNTIVQLLAHEEVRGRMSSMVMIALGLTPLGVLPIAIASAKYGISVTVFAACVLLAAIVLTFIFFSPVLRQLDQVLTNKTKNESEANDL